MHIDQVYAQFIDDCQCPFVRTERRIQLVADQPSRELVLEGEFAARRPVGPSVGDRFLDSLFVVHWLLLDCSDMGCPLLRRRRGSSHSARPG